MILRWIAVALLYIAGIASFFEALATTHSVWLGIPLLVLSGAFFGPATLLLLAMLGLYDFALEVNGHRAEFLKPPRD